MIELESHVGADTVVRPTGDLDWIGATALRHVADDLFRLGVNFVIDLGRTCRVDATGASALVGTVRRGRALGVDVRVVNPRPSIRRQLELMSIDQLVLCSNVNSGNDAA